MQVHGRLHAEQRDVRAESLRRHRRLRRRLQLRRRARPGARQRELAAADGRCTAQPRNPILFFKLNDFVKIYQSIRSARSLDRT